MGSPLRKGGPSWPRNSPNWGALEVHQVLEFGVQQGGSAAIWALIFPLRRYVGIDIGNLRLPFPTALKKHPRFRAVSLKGGVDQGDKSAVRQIMDREFSGPLDLVVDDASHQYEATTAPFEVAFPRLRPGGAYIIEDWNWAHHPGPWHEPGHPWAGNPSLVNLLFRLTMIAANREDIVARIVVHKSFAVIFRGPAHLDDTFTVAGAIGGRRPAPAVI
ncbi:hypothetical protein BH23CHL8_BH23CHL8_28800 [soil metagenome]